MNPELALIGCALQDPRIALASKARPHNFADGRYGHCWRTIAQHADRDGTTLSPAMVVAKLPDPDGLAAELVDAVTGTVVRDAEAYAEQVIEASERRDLASLATKVGQMLEDGHDLEDVRKVADGMLADDTGSDELALSVQTADEFVDQKLPPEQWIIPDMLAAGDRLILTGAEGAGKALALDTPIPTPTGWTTMGELRVGDYVLGMDGKPTQVIHATGVQLERNCYRVHFSDGASIVADEDHRWLTYTLKAREATAKLRKRGETKSRGTDQRHKMPRPEVVTTGRIRDTLHARGGHCLNHSIPATAPLDLPTTDLLIDPYVLGAWLGDGSSAHAVITTHPDDVAILDRIRSCGYTVTGRACDAYGWSITRQEERTRAKAQVLLDVAAGMSQREAESCNGIGRRDRAINPILSLREELRMMGLLGNKHIPAAYQRASIQQRLDLLRGLMDTDGTISANGAACEFSVSHERLAIDMLELIVGLGMKATIRESAATLNGREVNRRWRITFIPTVNPFHLPRKAARFIEPKTARGSHRYITRVEPIESVPVRCIQVDNADHMYLAGRAMIPTHNSMLLRQLGMCVAAGCHPFARHPIEPSRVLVIDAENPLGIMVRKFRGIRDSLRAGGFETGDRLLIHRAPGGLDLTKPEGRTILRSLCRMVGPDVIVIGPIYKLYVPSSERDEVHARQVAAVLDEMRAEHNCAVLTEHHTPMAQAGQPRTLRPVGTGLWMRWPEFGLGITPEDGTKVEDRRMKLRSWRGSREERAWPASLQGAGTAPGRLPWADANNIGVAWRVA